MPAVKFWLAGPNLDVLLVLRKRRENRRQREAEIACWTIDNKKRGGGQKMKGITKQDRGEEKKMWLIENNCVGKRRCLEQEGGGDR